MKTTLWILGCWTTIIQGVGMAGSPGAPSHEIIVQVYDAAGIEPSTLTRGETEAARIFAKAGISVRWVNCPEPDGKKRPERVCGETDDPLLFTVGIVSRTSPGAVSDIALGFALPFNGRGNHAGVVYSKVAEVQKDNSEVLGCGELLGNVIAHELGHLLFRSSQHGTDLMQAGWHAIDFKRMGQRQFTFSNEQARMLRIGLLARAGRTDGVLMALR